ncbi:MAG: DUF3037 domain-containing protein [Frankiales bacterium]|nr:DUF3037 domain-containing protein [Frankiales bacterium]
MSDLAVFEYAALRAVPRIERGECVNVGIVLFCHLRDFLAVAVHVDADRLRALDPEVDVTGVTAAAAALQRTCQGEGPAGQTSLGQRFRWLTAPRSTVLQAGPAHSGLTADPAIELERLLTALVR